MDGRASFDAVGDELSKGDVVLVVKDVSVSFGKRFQSANETRFPISLRA